MKEKTTLKVRFPEVKGENVHKLALICNGELVHERNNKRGVIVRQYKFPREIWVTDFIRELKAIESVEIME